MTAGDHAQPAMGQILQSLALGPQIVTLLEQYGRELAALRVEIAGLRNGSVAQSPSSKKWLKLKEAAALLNASPKTVRRYIHRGLLSRNAASRHILIPADDVENFRKRVCL